MLTSRGEGYAASLFGMITSLPIWCIVLSLCCSTIVHAASVSMIFTTCFFVAVYEDLHEQLADGDLCLVPPHIAVQYNSGMVVLQGSIVANTTTDESPFMDGSKPPTTQDGGEAPVQPVAECIEFWAPCVLPYIPGEMDAVPPTFWAGDNGAIIVCCPEPEYALMQQESLPKTSEPDANGGCIIPRVIVVPRSSFDRRLRLFTAVVWLAQKWINRILIYTLSCPFMVLDLSEMRDSHSVHNLSSAAAPRIVRRTSSISTPRRGRSAM